MPRQKGGLSLLPLILVLQPTMFLKQNHSLLPLQTEQNEKQTPALSGILALPLAEWVPPLLLMTHILRSLTIRDPEGAERPLMRWYGLPEDS